MAKYFNTLTGCLTDSTDGVPQVDEVVELSDLEYDMMRIRMHHNWEDCYNALEFADKLCDKVGV